jgi:predicted phosphodiesterase
VTDTLKLKPLRAVYGNIDDAKARLEFPLHNRFMCEGVDVWITHIGYPGNTILL